MIRRGSRRGGESGVGKSEAPFRINEDPVQSSKDRRILLVGPGELSVQERNFKEAEGIDEVVKAGSFLGVDVPVRLVAGSANQVEVTHDGRRARKGHEDIRKGVEKRLLEVMEARAIDIDD
jgi:hypothetical protein